MLSLYCQTQNTLFGFICSVEDLFTLTSNKFRMVYKVDRNPSLIHVTGACTRTSLMLFFFNKNRLASGCRNKSPTGSISLLLHNLLIMIATGTHSVSC